jgi:hypothetical protein
MMSVTLPFASMRMKALGANSAALPARARPSGSVKPSSSTPAAAPPCSSARRE